MTGKKTSPIWIETKEKVQELFDSSSTTGEVLKYFGLRNRGSNFRTLKSRVIEDNISLEQHNKNKKAYRRTRNCKKIPLEEILVISSNYSKSALKKRLIDEQLLKNQCSECGLLPIWNNKILSLQLEHKNGNSDDNRLENLTLLCPNCHSQTNTFAGKKLKNPKKIKLNMVRGYVPKFSNRKVERPDKETLAKLLLEKTAIEIAKEYGVSDVAVGKWAKYYQLERRPRGYKGQNHKSEV